eukprot:2844265-Alexandrium_andersonii.AAC.1
MGGAKARAVPHMLVVAQTDLVRRSRQSQEPGPGQTAERTWTPEQGWTTLEAVSYTHLRAHETSAHL